MRTDAKIGFAIGGVLLAVLTVYAIVVPKHKKTTGTVALVKTDTPTGADTPLIGTDGSSTGQVGALNGTPVPSHTDPIHTDAPHTDAGHTDAGRTDASHTDAGHSDPAHNELPHGDQPVDPSHELGMGGGSSTGPDLTRRDEHKPDNGTVVVRPTGERIKPHVTKPIPPFEVNDNTATADRLYTIQPGQTLSKIAYEVYGNARFYVAIQRENRGLDPNHLKVGTQIKLPEISPVPSDARVVTDEKVVVRAADRTVDRTVEGVIPPVDVVRAPSHSIVSDGRTYIVQQGDNLYAIARKLLGSGRKADLIYDMNRVLIGADKSRLKLGMVLKLPDSSRTAMAE